jgi:hypothetical protein
MVTRKTNKTIHSEGREIIANIIEKCDEEKAQMQFLLPLSKATNDLLCTLEYLVLQSRKSDKKTRQEKKHIWATV